jgi:hypothetical protein
MRSRDQPARYGPFFCAQHTLYIFSLATAETACQPSDGRCLGSPAVWFGSVRIIVRAWGSNLIQSKPVHSGKALRPKRSVVEPNWEFFSKLYVRAQGPSQIDSLTSLIRSGPTAPRRARFTTWESAAGRTTEDRRLNPRAQSALLWSTPNER